MTDERNPAYRYGQWSGNERGQAQNPIRCVRSVWPAISRGMIEAQCTRRRGHGFGGLYCKQHAKEEPR
jgi:hypothetical protein